MEWNVEPAEPRPPRTRRKALAWGALVGFILPLLVLAGMPLRTSGARDARKAEGTQLGGALRDFARVEHSKTGNDPPLGTRDIKFKTDDYTGKYYRGVAVVGHPTAETGEVFMVPLDDRNPTMRVVFEWNSGNSDIEDLDQ